MRALLALVLLAACTADTQTIDVAPRLVTCSLGSGPGACMTGTDETGAPVILYQGIDGFEFRWGDTRRVTFESHDVDDPPADGSSIRYVLVDDTLLSTAAPTDTFELAFEVVDNFLEPAAAADRVQFAGYQFACTPAVCADAAGRQGTITLDMTFEAPAGAVATIQQVR